MTGPQKITLGEMRASGVRGLLIYSSDFRRSHGTAISGDRWPDHIRLSDVEPLFACQVCGSGAPMSGQISTLGKRSHEKPAGLHRREMKSPTCRRQHAGPFVY
jgi:hypothetical protein